MSHQPGTSRTASILLLLLLLAANSAPSIAQIPFRTETVETAGDVGFSISLDLDDLGRPHLSYIERDSGELIYAVKEGGNWIKQLVDASLPAASSAECDIAVDQVGAAHIIYFDDSLLDLKYATNAGGSWVTETVDSAGSVGQTASIDIGSDGNPYISYYDYSETALYYGVKISGFWYLTKESFTSDRGLYSSIAMTSTNAAWISYYDAATGDLYSTFEDLPRLRSYGPVDTGGDVGQYSSIALDSGSRPHISYYDATNEDLKHAYLSADGLDWTVETVDASGNVGRNCSIAVDQNDVIHISYYDVTGNDLKYAYRSVVGGGWTIERVTLNDFVGTDATSIAVDNQGMPRIAYYDNFGGAALYLDAAVHVREPGDGEVWSVGTTRSIVWEGGGAVNLLLSTDGGATWITLAYGVGGTFGSQYGSFPITVPHTPSHFCKISVWRPYPSSTSISSGFFTIEADIVLLGLSAEPARDLGGVTLSWNTDPGPEDLAGYRIERRHANEAWSEIARVGKISSYHDPGGVAGDRYGLYAINGLGHEYYLGETSSGPAAAASQALTLWPTPYRGGTLNVAFATGAAGGVRARSTVAIYDVNGRRVRELVAGEYGSGFETVFWDGRDENGQEVASGIYIVRATSGSTAVTKKLVVVR